MDTKLTAQGVTPRTQLPLFCSGSWWLNNCSSIHQPKCLWMMSKAKASLGSKFLTPFPICTIIQTVFHFNKVAWFQIAKLQQKTTTSNKISCMVLFGGGGSTGWFINQTFHCCWSFWVKYWDPAVGLRWVRKDLFGWLYYLSFWLFPLDCGGFGEIPFCLMLWFSGLPGK